MEYLQENERLVFMPDGKIQLRKVEVARYVDFEYFEVIKEWDSLSDFITYLLKNRNLTAKTH